MGIFYIVRMCFRVHFGPVTVFSEYTQAVKLTTNLNIWENMIQLADPSFIQVWVTNKSSFHPAPEF